ncbi:SGNH/GDSL hydrolase family protein [Paludisphaera borealis]|uniref:SGNH hydrolase-type esterase domain-containing protein n=1 Tax=Paludisphaera borealis TaxID=1387353 RepID=A0A1U7CT40_9BACT|nr:SGNH/GDSL hydrolase family protein [Paludisphaera borealis]APW62107.1 hypothetical protein BSF38_03639 [Paludisphaera borealis]
MALFQSTSVAAARVGMAQAAILVAITFIPVPAGWTRTQRLLASASSSQPNRADGDHHATGYYEGLIGGEAQGGRGELTLKLMGKPNGWMRFNDAGVARHLTSDFLQFELVPEMDSILFGQRFLTNTHGMHSPEVTVEKPAKTFRIAVLGASMDMGWGVQFQDTYSHLLESWLNAHAAHQAFTSDRKFEVLNFAVAAYSPLQRLESFRRKVREFKPDLVIFSSTLLDVRLMEIHLCDMFRTKSDPTYGFLHDLIARAGINDQDRYVDPKGDLVNKERIKAKLSPYYWELYDSTVGALAGDCRTAGIPLLMIVIPRVGKDDDATVRAEPVARLKAIAGRYGLPIFDLSDTFDELDPATLEIAAWDDHPNALGHHRLFLALTHHLVTDQGRYELLFPGRKAAAEASLPPDLP